MLEKLIIILRHTKKRLKSIFRIMSKNIKLILRKSNPFYHTYTIHKTAKLNKRNLILIDDYVEIKDYVILQAYQGAIRIGKFSQINPFTVIYGGREDVIIGDNVLIAPHCIIAAGNHDYLQTEKPMRFAGSLTKGPVVIEDNVWIGANCTITDGVRIGREAVVGANSLVNKDVDPYTIVGGVPAKVIGRRE